VSGDALLAVGLLYLNVAIICALLYFGMRGRK